jgi:hypothetical protein
MKVSVVVVTYNHRPYIEQALASVLAQRSAHEIEILISDDASTDGTRELVQAWGARHRDRVRLLISERNLNSNEVIARALRACRGDYVALLDGDDYWTAADKLDAQVRFLEDHPGCSGCFHNVEVVEEGTPWRARRNSCDEPRVRDLDDLMTMNPAATCSLMFRRAAVADLPPWFEPLMCGDWALLLLAARHGPVGYINRVLATYRVHPGGVWSRLTRVEQLQESVDVLLSLAEPFDAAHISRARSRAARYTSELALERTRLAEEDNVRCLHAIGRSRRSVARHVAAVAASIAPEPGEVAIVSGTLDRWPADQRGRWRPFPHHEGARPGKLFATGPAGTAPAAWIRGDTTYDFALYGAGQTTTPLAEACVRRRGEAFVAVGAGDTRASAVVRWSTGTTAEGEVFTSVDGGPERRRAAGVAGTCVIELGPEGATTDIHLYGGDPPVRPLATARVARRRGAWIEATPNPVPPGAGLGRTTVSWSTGDGRDGRVVVSENGSDVGYHPVDTEAVVSLLRAEQERGLAALVFPRTAFWWFDHYPALAAHLSAIGGLAWSDETCRVYRLTSAPHARSGSDA